MKLTKMLTRMPCGTTAVLGWCLAIALSLLAGTVEAGAKPSAPSAKSEFEYDGDFLRNLAGGLQQGNAYNGYLKLGETLACGNWEDPADSSNPRREFALHASVIYPHGENLSRDKVGDLNGVSNYYANTGLRLFSFWAEKNFFTSRVSLRVGLWALDKGSGFWQSEGAGHFLNGGFGTFPVLSNGLVTAAYPVSAPCIRLEWQPVEALPLTLRTAICSGDVGTPADNRHNTQWHLRSSDGVAAFAEAEYKAKSADGSLLGTYKTGGFFDSKWFDDLSGGHQHHGNCGLYAIADEDVRSMITSAPQELAVFAKFALAPQDRNFVTFDTEAGMSYTGLMAKAAGREDVLALGVSHSTISDSARDGVGNAFPSHYETVLELTYQSHLPMLERNAVSVLMQPDLQYIIHPGAVNRTPNALVGGVRLTVRF
ncbi:MAG: carbohydrate porin [Verrucomicrobia bacterium]|nr:MAG: carbohydrate porin [Verrucomicrobiota bacterium]